MERPPSLTGQNFPLPDNSSCAPIVTGRPEVVTEVAERCSTYADDVTDLVKYDDPSKAPFYDLSFQDAIDRGVELASSISHCLNQCPTGHVPINIQKEARLMAKYEPQVERIVGIVGKSGAGKSSLVNSLLDVEGLAKTAAGGSAVTAFVIEYRQKLDRHQKDFSIETECLTPADVDDQLQYLLEDFRRLAFTDVGGLRDEEHSTMESQADAAKAVFKAAFGRVDGFNLGLLEHENNKEARDVALRQLRLWAKELHWPSDMVGRFWTDGTDEAHECHSLMKVFLDNGLWPFIKSMKVYLEAHLLRGGIVLADLPGYHEVNFARMKASREYQADCSEVFVVAEIKRAVDDPVVQDVLNCHENESLGTAGSAITNVTVVCTHSALAVPEGKDLGTWINKQRLMQARNRLDAVKKEKVSGSIEEILQRHKDVKLDHDALLIRARNARVKSALQSCYKSVSTSVELPVFCVDNALYSEDSEKSKEVSNIPQLRMYTMTLPVQARFKHANKFLGAKLPSLLGSFELWADVSREETASRLKRDLPTTKTLRTLALQDIRFVKTRQSIQDHLRAPIIRVKGEIVRDALATAQQWQSMRWRSVESWFNNRGTHRTRTIGWKCWNTELASVLNRAGGESWRQIDYAMFSEQLRLRKNALGAIANFNELCVKAGAPETFSRSIQAEEQLLNCNIRDIEVKFQHGFTKIQKKATSGSPTSYMVKYMEPAYRQGSSDSGNLKQTLMPIYTVLTICRSRSHSEKTRTTHRPHLKRRLCRQPV